MSYIEGVSREQVLLFPEVVEEYVSLDNPVRFIDAFVSKLDLGQKGFQHSQLKETGRPPYHPGDLLRLYIYGYLNRIRSSRRLEVEAQRNVELMWLIKKLAPDFKTIADFRKDNRQAIKEVCRDFTVLCKQMDLFNRELVAIDGSKFRAVNSKRRNFNQGKLKEAIQEIEKKVESYLEAVDQKDQEEAGLKKDNAQELSRKIASLKDRQEQYQKLLAQLQESGQTQVSLTDPDSRAMSQGQGTTVGYNVQMAVDEKHKLIVEHEVTNSPSDLNQLSSMAIQAQDALGAKDLKVVADQGYYHGKEVLKCQSVGIEVHMSKPITSANTKQGLFGKESFKYDSEKDCYVCPAGQELRFQYKSFELGRSIRYYKTKACQSCLIKPQCTRNKQGRRISRWEHEAVLEEMEARVKADASVLRKRKSIVEHPFGTIKRAMEAGYFLCRGLEKVGTEMSLTVLAYNIKRVVNILGVRRMIQALG